ncbi:MAG: tRNA (guanine(10)-N(2))-dimethyltransferase [Candidatus Thorarchaeota archaeon]|nr:MAG: tRNA (guanine(10)-N(2))-dimethyltransferase [Candidatus Thorarchaeota archaeon]
MTIEREYTEGKTTFISADVEHYSESKGQPTTSLPVFYNPRMRLNRDLSVIFLSAYMSNNRINRICEPLTGSGVRTLRYLNECEGTFEALMFDANPLAVDTARRNVRRLGFQNRATVMRGDAKILLLTESREKRFDFVDVDPFGTPAPYLSAAVQSLRPKLGLLAVTATDMPVLCGVYPRVALRKYGGFSIRAPFVHEIAVRLLLGQIFRVAGANDSAMTPLVSLSSDHYVRVWVKIEADRKSANRLVSSYGTIRYCPSCMVTQTLPLADRQQEFVHADGCEGKYREAGPLWIGDIFDMDYLAKAESSLEKHGTEMHRRAPDVIQKMGMEAHLMDYPYVDLHAVCDRFNLSPPRNVRVMEKLRDQGYIVSPTHFRPTAIRTNAQVQEIVNIIERIQEQ